MSEPDTIQPGPEPAPSDKGRVMINLRWVLASGEELMTYDTYPQSQITPAEVPAGALTCSVWLGIR